MKRLLKAIVFGVCLIADLPLILAAGLERLWGGERIFVFCSQLLSLVPGLPGACLRAAFYCVTLESCSWETHVGFGSIFSHRSVTLGARSSMGSYCVIGHARIGESVMMGSRVSIPSGKRQHLDESGRLSSSRTTFDAVRIGGGTWVGEGAIVMADVGAHCIVSAGAVVTRKMPDACLIGGNPASVLRELEPVQPARVADPCARGALEE
ncbi:MAG: acyltransferase [Steroidobacteraceae bacterium]